MEEERQVKTGYEKNVEGNRERERSQRRWRDEMKELLMRRGLNERRECCWLEIGKLGVWWYIDQSGWKA